MTCEQHNKKLPILPCIPLPCPIVLLSTVIYDEVTLILYILLASESADKFDYFSNFMTSFVFLSSYITQNLQNDVDNEGDGPI